MGNQKWTAEEEDAFQRGVQKYAAGKWANILKDPEFSKALSRRTNVDLKDKWRNLNGPPSRNPKTPKAKPLVHVPSSSEVNATPTPVVAAAPPSANVIVRNAAIAPQNDANIYPKEMGNQKQKWTAEEEEALTKGVNKYGAGKWKHILKDPELSPKLASRSNIDLKDKWRNLNVFNGQNPRTPKGAASPAPNNATPSPSSSSAAAAAPAPGNAAVQNVDVAPQAQTPIRTPVRQPSQNDEEAKVIPKYNSLIYEALATIKDTNGSDLNAIIRFIEQKHNWPQNPNFRRTLGSKLRRLVSQGKLEKVLNGYKIKDTSVGTKIADDSKPPAPEEMDLPSSSNNFFEQASSSNNNLAFEDALREASETLACRVAEVDNKSFLAAAAVKETERYAKFQEENDAMLMIAEELLAKCMLGGTVRFN